MLRNPLLGFDKGSGYQVLSKTGVPDFGSWVAVSGSQTWVLGLKFRVLGLVSQVLLCSFFKNLPLLSPRRTHSLSLSKGTDKAVLFPTKVVIT